MKGSRRCSDRPGALISGATALAYHAALRRPYAAAPDETPWFAIALSCTLVSVTASILAQRRDAGRGAVCAS